MGFDSAEMVNHRKPSDNRTLRNSHLTQYTWYNLMQTSIVCEQ